MIRKRFEDIMLPYGIARKGHTNLWFFFNKEHSKLGTFNTGDYMNNVPDTDCIEVENSKMYKVIEDLIKKSSIEQEDGKDVYIVKVWPVNWFKGHEDKELDKKAINWVVGEYIKILLQFFDKKKMYKDHLKWGVNGNVLARQFLPYFFKIKDGLFFASNREYSNIGTNITTNGGGHNDYQFCKFDPILASIINKHFDTDILKDRDNGDLHYLYENREKCEPYIYTKGYFALLKKFLCDIVKNEVCLMPANEPIN